MLSVHTLEARDNAMLDVAFQNPAESPETIRREIASALATATSQLKDRRVPYAELRTALTPQVDKRELALMFDSAVMDGWYGGQAAEAVLPHLNRKGNHSILSGDIIWKDLDTLFAALDKEAVIWGRPKIYMSNQIYVVYVTNLSDSAFNALVAGVKGAPGAMGYVDCTYAGVIKTILSTCIGTRYVKYGGRFINSHPFDSEPDANENGPFWPLEDFGYDFVSIEDIYFDLLLCYKIEAIVPAFAFNDGHFSLAAAAGIWKDPRSIPMFVEEAKLEYLAKEKGGSLAKVGLTDLPTEELAKKLQEKLASSYIYNLVWNSDKDFSNFATMIEFNNNGRRTRLRAVLKYEDEQLGLVSLFG
ncbi:hypothetical protein [Nocardioides sp.]|uniref:hypothetical protein n=1 Tax=Nocardioides sp. TaxID=35761 RepID=UPI0025F87C97|nr:hypothetical protein [Nocardioides sp.]